MGRPKHSRIERVCETCGAAFQALAVEVRRDGAKYCSRPCYYYRDGRMPKTERTCLICEKVFLPISHRKDSRYCSRECYYASQVIPIETQFRRGVGETNEHGCVLWNGLTDHNGRGVVYSTTRPPQRTFIAARIAWEVANGPIPDGVCVLHNCPGGDNPLCVNAEHLFLGTQLDNIDDMARKGRSPNRKLTDDEILAVRSRYAAGGISQQKLADEYGVHQTCISGIVRCHRWKYVE
jgi:hypothetical protein